MAEAAPEAIRPGLRLLFYFLLAGDFVLLIQASLPIAHHVADAYAHQHLRSVLLPLTGCVIILSVLTPRLTAKRWLLVAAFALLAYNEYVAW
jgi:hypothetical protein